MISAPARRGDQGLRREAGEARAVLEQQGEKKPSQAAGGRRGEPQGQAEGVTAASRGLQSAFLFVERRQLGLNVGFEVIAADQSNMRSLIQNELPGDVAFAACRPVRDSRP